MTREDPELASLWEQAQRCAQALDSAFRIKNKNAIRIHRATLLSLIKKIQQKIEDNKNEKNT